MVENRVEQELDFELKGVARVAYRLIRSVLRLAMKFWFRLEVTGGENLPADGGFVMAPGGHRSILDTPSVALAGPRVLRYMGAESYFKIPGVGWFLRTMGGFPVERDATDRRALKLAEQIINHGEPLAVFPEGTRQQGPIVQPLKQGAAYLACRTGAPIVPLGAGGAERALPKGKYFPRPRKLTLVVGEPIYPPTAVQGARVRRSDVTQLSEQLREALQALFDEAQIRAGQ